MRMGLFRKFRVLEKFLFYVWTKNVVTFSDCLFLPDHSHNLISVSEIRQNGAQLNFGQSLSSFVKRKTTFPFKEA